MMFENHVKFRTNKHHDLPNLSTPALISDVNHAFCCVCSLTCFQTSFMVCHGFFAVLECLFLEEGRVYDGIKGKVQANINLMKALNSSIKEIHYKVNFSYEPY